jgi:hypothetical protein
MLRGTGPELTALLGSESTLQFGAAMPVALAVTARADPGA